jgi:hypothetical protein
MLTDVIIILQLSGLIEGAQWISKGDMLGTLTFACRQRRHLRPIENCLQLGLPVSGPVGAP